VVRTTALTTRHAYRNVCGEREYLNCQLFLVCHCLVKGTIFRQMSDIKCEYVTKQNHTRYIRARTSYL